MTVHESLMTDLKEILETVSRIQKVSYGKHVALDQESDFASAYLIPGADTFTPRVIGTGVSSYDNSFFVRVIVNEDCTDNPLQWCITRDLIIQAVLKDSKLWSTAIDRDITSVIYDDMNSFPHMTMELLFEFKLKEECT